MNKKLGIIKLSVISGKASPTPPLGPALGQKGLNIINFCKNFNLQTISIQPSILLPVLITYYVDKSYCFIIKKPTVFCLLKDLIKIKKGSDKPKINNIHKISYNNIKEIVKFKISDFNTENFYSCFKIVLGCVKSIGIDF